MTKWEVVFDGTEKVGKVMLSDGGIDAVAQFDTDEEARTFFNLLCALKDARLDAEIRLTRVKHYLDEAQREADK